jgi:hypothetical protein
MIADALLEIPIFRDFLSFLSSREDRTVELDELDQFIVGDFTQEELQKIKNAFLNWGRFAELIWVDSEEREIHLEEEEEEA